MLKKYVLVTVGALALASGSANAAIIAGGNVGGFQTFKDTNTNRFWLRLDSFLGLSVNQMIAAATSAGFTVAQRSDVEVLLGSLPLGGSNWTGYAAITGRAPNRPLIWGAYGPVQPSGNAGWAFAFDGASAWSFNDDVFPASVVANGGSPFADQNLFAYSAAGGVPEPASWAFMIAGFGAAGLALRSARSNKVSVTYGNA